MEGAVLSGTDALFLFEKSGEIQGVFVADGQRDDGDGQVCPQQQVAGLPDTQVQKVFLKGRPGGGVAAPLRSREK